MHCDIYEIKRFAAIPYTSAIRQITIIVLCLSIISTHYGGSYQIYCGIEMELLRINASASVREIYTKCIRAYKQNLPTSHFNNHCVKFPGNVQRNEIKADQCLRDLYGVGI